MRRGNCIVRDDGSVLIEYTQNRYLRLTDEAASAIISRIGGRMSLRGIYETVGGIKFRLDNNGKYIGAE